MAKATTNDQFLEGLFPLRGIDVAEPVSGQRPLTTRVGKNVRANEPRTMRDRGGSRCGLVKFVPETVSGANKIDHLNIIVDPTVDALQSDPPGTGMPDPSTNNLSQRVPFGRLIRIGGSGRWYSRHTPTFKPAFRQAKSATFAQSDASRSVTFDGFVITDNLIVVFVAIQRGVNKVFIPTDPLAWVADTPQFWATGQLVSNGPVVNPPTNPQLFPNKAGFVDPTMTDNYPINGWTLVTQETDYIVTATAPAGLLAPGTYRGGSYNHYSAHPDNSEFTPNLYNYSSVGRLDNYLFLSVALPILGATVQVTDDQNNVYTQRGGWIDDVTTGMRFGMFTTRSVGSVGNTISVQPKMGADPYAVTMGIAACEYSGFSHSTIDGTLNQATGSSTTPSTTGIPITLGGSIAIAAFAQCTDNLTLTTPSGESLRTHTDRGDIGCAIYVVDKNNPPVGNTVTLSGTLSSTARWIGIGKAFK